MIIYEILNFFEDNPIFDLKMTKFEFILYGLALVICILCDIIICLLLDYCKI